MRKGKVYVKGILAGIIQEDSEGFLFVYEDAYMSDQMATSVSLTIPQTGKTHRSEHLKPAPGNRTLAHRQFTPANEHLTMQIARQVFGIILPNAQ